MNKTFPSFTRMSMYNKDQINILFFSIYCKIFCLPAKNFIKTRIQFDLIFFQIFIEFICTQHFRNSNKLNFAKHHFFKYSSNKNELDHNCHVHERMVLYERSYWLTYNLNSTYPMNNHSIDNRQAVQVL